jgi:hypothetical protein
VIIEIKLGIVKNEGGKLWVVWGSADRGKRKKRNNERKN